MPEVPDQVLDPRSAWRDPDDYDRQARKLKAMFDENISHVSEGGSAAG